LSDKPVTTEEVVERIEELAASHDFKLQAYDFVMRGLEHTLSSLDEVRHVNGRELLRGIESFAKEEFGPMAKHVLNTWGVNSTRDFGEIVFHLVGQGILKKTDDDTLDDFVDEFDFEEVFEREYYRDHPIFHE